MAGASGTRLAPFRRFRSLTPGKGRRKCLKVALGGDPALEKRQARRRVGEGTVAALADEFLASRESAKWRPKTREEFERLVRAEIVPAIGDMGPAAVTRGIIRQMVERIAGWREVARGLAAQTGTLRGKPSLASDEAAVVLGTRSGKSPGVASSRPHEANRGEAARHRVHGRPDLGDFRCGCCCR